ncbi:MAG: ABC transporter ATP-binding protein [Acidimicrobiia bacterium]|jgi:putative ABC transport system ATP-binding protein
MSAAVRTADLTKTYGEGDTAVRALRDVSVEIPRGEFVVLLGASGSGKTTFLNQVGALESPTSGTVEADGHDLAGMDDEEQTVYRLNSVGFIFQLYNLVPTLTALENVELIAELTGSSASDRARTVLEEVGLGDRLDYFPGQLSGGQQQRVSIARGLVKDPPLLLADEPTGALDVATGVQILDLLRQTVADGKRSVLTVTHNTDIARVAHRVIELRDGEVVNVTTNSDPADPDSVTW